MFPMFTYIRLKEENFDLKAIKYVFKGYKSYHPSIQKVLCIRWYYLCLD